VTPRPISPLDATWLLLESRDTPMHVGGLFEFTPPADAPADFLKNEYERLRESRAIPPPWNLKLVQGPLVGPRLPLMREDHDVDIDYHVRHSALPYPGGQRELGILVSRLHSHQLDLHRPLQAPYRSPSSALQHHLGGQRRFATQRFELDLIKSLAKAGGCTINDLVLYLSGSALRRYLAEHDRVPERPLTAGIPVNLREADDQSMGTAVGMMVAELGTNIADPWDRLEAVKESTEAAKKHLREVPPAGRSSYTLLINGPYIAGLIAGLGGHAPVPFNIGISNVPGPTQPLYFNGSRLDALFPLSLLLHGNALNITCLSYAGTLNFGFTGARDTLPHLQRLAIYMSDAVEEISEILRPDVAPALR
jgi:hypothetical protein